MLRSGIPLEGALRQLSSSLRRGALKEELQQLEADLAKGLPLGEALANRNFPDLYRRMVVVGTQGSDLPGILTLMADHYQRVNAIGARLKGLMVYPSIVVFASLALSVFLALFFRNFTRDLPQILSDANMELIVTPGVMVLVWMPVIALGATTLVLVTALFLPPFRRWLRWHLPGFKEAGLAQLASAMSVMLKAGTTLADSLGLLGYLENNTPVGRDIVQWQHRLAQGHARFAEIAANSRIVPPLFFWVVNSAEEDLAQGFQRAAEIYQARAAYRVEVFLYAALPVSILFLGSMLVSQAYPVIRLFAQFGTMIDRLGA
ncbi:MAG: type II secretion system F family protein [Verrucomicrobiota bacterium]